MVHESFKCYRFGNGDEWMYGKNAKCHYGSWLNPLVKNAPGWRDLPHPKSFLLCRDRSPGTAGSAEECGDAKIEPAC